MRVFVSYRRDDAGGRAGRLCDSIAARIGAANVFHDVRSIAPGHDFDAEIRRAIDACDVVLVVVGRGWSSTTGHDGRRRLDEADDYVVLEVAAGLRSGKNVVPVLVDDAAMPALADLPESIASLAGRQAVTVRDAAWHTDVAALLARLEGGDPEEPQHWRRRLAIGVTVAAALAAVMVVLAVRRGGGDAGASRLPSCGTVDDTWTVLPLAESTAVFTDDERTIEFRAVRAALRQRDGWTLAVDVEISNKSIPAGPSERTFYPEASDFAHAVVDGLAGPVATCLGRTSDNALDPGRRTIVQLRYPLPSDPTGTELLVETPGQPITVTRGR